MDSLENAGSLSYQRLAGDHAIVQTQEITVDTRVIELDSLFLGLEPQTSSAAAIPHWNQLLTIRYILNFTSTGS